MLFVTQYSRYFRGSRSEMKRNLHFREAQRSTGDKVARSEPLKEVSARGDIRSRYVIALPRNGYASNVWRFLLSNAAV
jgi:hypothetical protein